MKQCPQCRVTYADPEMNFCLNDGARLVEPLPADSEATLLFDTASVGKLTSAARSGPAASIAVLPFANMSAEPDNEFFCDGLAEEILNALAKIDSLKVAARTSSFSFKGKDVTVADIGSALGVGSVLEGSVRRSGNRLRITAQLISVSDGYHLWSERFDREMKDIFDVQDEITLAVVGALKLKLLGGERSAVLKRHTQNTEAYELYLQGRYNYSKYSPEGWRRAIELFEKAVESDANYAPAYTGLGSVLLFCWFFGVLEAEPSIARSRAAADAAVRLDDSLAEAHSLLARIHFWYEWDWNGAEDEFRKAIELNGSDPEARQQFGIFLAAIRKSEEAIVQAETALDLDPFSLMVNLQAGWIYQFLGRSDEAEALAHKMLEMEPNFHGAYWLLSIITGARNQISEALEFSRRAVDLGSYQMVLSNIGFYSALLGRTEEARKMLDELLSLRGREPVHAINIARLYAGFRDKEKTVEWLEKAVEERNGDVVLLNTYTATGGIFHHLLGDDPRLAAIKARIGFP